MAINRELEEACRAIGERSLLVPRVAIVLGSGLGALAEHVEHSVKIPYSAIPGFPLSHAHGHAGYLHLGYIGGVCVVVMQGRAHLYEGHSVEKATFPIRVMRQLGAETLILSNASGGMNTRFVSGDLMVIDEHIDLMFRTGIRSSDFPSSFAPSDLPSRSGAVYDPNWIRLAHATAKKLGIRLQQGTYLATLGPTYETRAEYRFFHRIGADAVGMSTVPEACLAHQIGFRILGFSVITNVARPDVLEKTSHAEVLDFAAVAQTKLVPLVQALLQDLAGPPD